jgi:hypothetical protein
VGYDETASMSTDTTGVSEREGQCSGWVSVPACQLGCIEERFGVKCRYLSGAAVEERAAALQG